MAGDIPDYWWMNNILTWGDVDDSGTSCTTGGNISSSDIVCEAIYGHVAPCPSCGYCPTCGSRRGRDWTRPYIPDDYADCVCQN
jgi:hypothetical protein